MFDDCRLALPTASRWFWSGTNLTLTDDDMAPSAFDPIATLVTLGRTRVINLTRQDGQDGSSTIAIADGEVLYVDRSGSTDKNIDDLNVQVYDMQGRLLLTKQITESNEQIDISIIPQGIYLTKITNQKTSSNYKLIISR